MPRYLLAVTFEPGAVDTPMEEWQPEEIDAHLDYYRVLHHELVASGELVQAEVRAGPDLATIVPPDGTSPVLTGRPVQELEEWLARLQVADGRSGEPRY